MERFSHSGFGKRDLSNNEHWTELDLETYRITKPVIICLGGNCTTDYKKAKRFCGTAERLIGLKEHAIAGHFSYDHVDILGFYYGKDKEEDSSGHFSTKYVSKIVDNLFIPLLTDENGNRLPIDKACKNFSLVNVFAHCHGGREINYMLSELNDKLLSKGYTKEDIKVIYSQGFQLSYSPMPDETWLPCVRVDSFMDSFNFCYGMRKMYEETYGGQLNGVAVKLDEPGFFRKKQNKCNHNGLVSVFASQLINTIENSDPKSLIDEHSADCIERNNDWSISKGASCADAVSRIMSRTLTSALENSIANCFKYPKLKPKKSIRGTFNECNYILGFFNKKDLERKF